MKNISRVLNDPAALYESNLNPIRVGLLIYEITVYICYFYKISHHQQESIKTKAAESICKLSESYKDPNELIEILESINLEGKEALWYIHEFGLNDILNAESFDRYIENRWMGRLEFNSKIQDMSTLHYFYANYCNCMM